MKMRSFLNRHQAGQILATRLTAYANRPNVIVIALPRGGVPVAYPIALALNAPLDVLTVRKLALPEMPELAIGAIGPGGIRVLNEEAIRVSGEQLENITRTEQKELERRERLYRANRTPLEVAGKVVIVVDDGLATGTTMLAAINALKGLKPDRLVVAVPVAASETYYEFKARVDEIVCVLTRELLYSIGEWYQDFTQTTDAKVCRLLTLAVDR